MAEITLRCIGVNVHIEIEEPIPSAFDSGDGSVWDGNMTLSREGLAISVPVLGLTWNTRTGDPNSFAEEFDALCAHFGFLPSQGLFGLLSAQALKWLEGRRPQSDVGGPRREYRWNAEKEKFMALVQSRIQDDHMDITNAIKETKRHHPSLFRKAFGTAKIESVRRHHTRWKKAFDIAPPNAVGSCRIKGIHFEFTEPITK